MYPFLRLIKEFIAHRNAPALGVTDMHVSTHICWPWDLDFWMELNNGRTLTLYDLGRLPLAKRAGLIAAMRRKGWGLTMAGAVVRYRRRVRVFDRITMTSRAICWDEKFFYIEQSMWVRGEATSHIVYRSAITGASGIVPPETAMNEVAPGTESPPVPAWVATWLEAEDQRPWPPPDPNAAKL